jgi:hypothetical protein
MLQPTLRKSSSLLQVGMQRQGCSLQLFDERLAYFSHF